jgi:hypothetical protein
MPDIRVERSPADEASGEDRQLQTAIDDLVSQLDQSSDQPEN